MFAKFILLFLVWIGLTNSLQGSELIVGAGVALFVAYFFGGDEKLDLFVLFKRHLFFVPKFLFSLLASNLEVAKIVLNPKLPINPAIIKVNIEKKTDFEKLLLANSITLTPGTITLDIQEEYMFVHILDLNNSVFRVSNSVTL